MLGKIEEHKDEISISVSDSGHGIDPKHRESIFNPFFTTKARGVGLGLAMATKIVDASGGVLALLPFRVQELFFELFFLTATRRVENEIESLHSDKIRRASRTHLCARRRWRARMKPGKGIDVAKKFKIGDHVTWNSEAGRVSGTIQKIHTRDFDYKGYTHHASADDPQYEIKSDKTGHIAAHKGGVLKKSARKKEA